MKPNASFATQLPDGTLCRFIMRPDAVKRMSRTCFRGAGIARAGNFINWEDFHQMLEDRFILEAATNDIVRAINAKGPAAANDFYRLEIECNHVIGWSRTTDLEAPDQMLRLVSPDLVEEFAPSAHATAHRVKLDCTTEEAPLTRHLTMLYELYVERGDEWVAVVRTVYPGKDIGVLSGDITDRENVVFFDFEHPGQSLG